MKKKLTINDVIHFYLSHYCNSKEINGLATMWSEMNDIKEYYEETSNPSKAHYSVDQIVRMCVIGLYSTGHQKRLSKDSVDEAVRKILDEAIIPVDKKKYTLFHAIRKTSFHLNDFEELYEYVKELIGGVTGIGYVTIYDTARRIGHLLKEPIYPSAYVYLHYNKVNSAARSILPFNKLGYREPSTLFMCDFGTFPSICIEDLLCVFSDVFVNVKQTRDDAEETVQTFNKKNWRNKSLSEFVLEQSTKYKNAPKAKRWSEFV